MLPPYLWRLPWTHYPILEVLLDKHSLPAEASHLLLQIFVHVESYLLRNFLALGVGDFLIIQYLVDVLAGVRVLVLEILVSLFHEDVYFSIEHDVKFVSEFSLVEQDLILAVPLVL